MNRRIAFLHTADGHVSTFNALLAQSEMEVIHTVRADWLNEVRRCGLTDGLVTIVSDHLKAVATESAVVVCTCSSLGPIVAQLGLPNVFRIDEPLMRAAARHSSVLLSMCLDSTRVASGGLLEKAFSELGKTPDYRELLCDEAWLYFERSEQDEFGRSIASSVRADIEEHDQTGCVVLAQASMATAEVHLRDIGIPVYSSPALAVEKALKIVSDLPGG